MRIEKNESNKGRAASRVTAGSQHGFGPIARSVLSLTMLSLAATAVGCAEDGAGESPDNLGYQSPAIVQQGFSQLVSASSGKCMDVYRSIDENNVPLQQYECGGIKPNQLFSMEDAGDGLVYIKNAGRCLSVYKASVSNNEQLVLFDCKGKPNQEWQVRRLNSDEFEIVGLQSQKCISVYKNSHDDKAALVIFECVGAQNQVWSEGLVVSS